MISRLVIYILVLYSVTIQSDEECKEVRKRKSKAILIGINHYSLTVKDKKLGTVFNLGNLTESVRDVKSLSGTLKELPKMEMIEMTDDLVPENPYYPNKKNIQKQLENTEDYDFVILFFSGHGKNNFIYSVERTGDIEKEEIEIPVESIYSTLNKNNVKNALVIIDACRDKESEPIGFSPNSNHNYKGLYSTSISEYSLEDYRLSKYLRKGLEGKYGSENGRLTSNFLFGEVIKNIKRDSRMLQTPLDPSSHSIPILIKCSVGNNGYNPPKEEIPIKVKPEKSPYNWMASFLFPGAGQYFKGQIRKSSYFFFSTIALGAYGYSQENRYKNAKAEYDATFTSILLAPTGVDILLYSSLGKSMDKANVSAQNLEVTSIVFACMYLINIYDAIVSEKDMDWANMQYSPKFRIQYSNTRLYSILPEPSWTFSYQANF